MIQIATYEIVRDGNLDTVTDLPAPVGVGEVIFVQDSFWRVDAIEQTTSDVVDGGLVVSFTTDAPPPPPAA